MSNFSFEHIEYLYIVAIVACLGETFRILRKKKSKLIFPAALHLIENKRTTLRIYSRYLPRIFNFMAILFVGAALAQPALHDYKSVVKGEGIDINIVIDASTSMLTADFLPNRFARAVSTAGEFVKNRPYDRIGVTMFAAGAYTLCPQTYDKSAALSAIQNAKTGETEDGTAIGSAVALAAARLRNSEFKSKIIILLTDGVNNSGQIAPDDGAKIATDLGIKIYAIGIGSGDLAGKTLGKDAYDPEALANLSAISGGEFYGVGDAKSLTNIFKTIDGLEKTKAQIETVDMSKDLYKYFLACAFSCVFLNIIFLTLYIRRAN